MGAFNISTPILDISTSPGSDSSHVSSVPFLTMYLDDPCTLPSPSTSNEHNRTTRMRMLFPIVEIVYQATLDPTVDPGPSYSQKKEEDLLALPS